MSEIKERPILFSGEMVRAIIDGRQTQTRRVIKPQPDYVNRDGSGCAKKKTLQQYYEGQLVTLDHVAGKPNSLLCDVIKCPYGAAGERIWVRETWQAWKEYDALKADDLPEKMRSRINYPADGNKWDARLRSSIHMPRWASRLTLEVCNIRIERLQEISSRDALAEGVKSNGHALPKLAYLELWDSINGEGAWGENPWVWVVEFRRLTEPKR